jgi:DNA-binding winged helix-turn-helix (wHTH) protein
MLYRFGRFELDRRSYELRRDGVALRVEPKVLDLPLYLAGNPDRLLSKQELLDSVWPGTAVSEGSLTRAITSPT